MMKPTKEQVEKVLHWLQAAENREQVNTVLSEVGEAALAILRKHNIL